jgi:hypothetical protein
VNVLFVSPAFPPNAYLFCTALAARGIRVLGIGDEPPERLRPELAAALAEYVFSPAMGDYAELKAAVRGLVERHGAIDRLDSNGEHWLEAEGRLRDDFGVPGLGHADVLRLRSKLAMAEQFQAAGIAVPPTIRCESLDAVTSFAERHGFPLVIKPDAGSGAVDTFTVHDEVELRLAFASLADGRILQPFVHGDIATFDGLVDGEGEIVFCTSHVYDAGIMQVRRDALDGYYYSLRVIPPAVEAAGRRSVAGFGLRERFFHVEFFARADGSLVALEMNVRPPGGYSTDMMIHATGVDVYALWAAMLAGDRLVGLEYHRAHHVAHVGRRRERSYRESPETLSAALGPTLVETLDVPDAFAATMGNVAYLLRHPELAGLLRAVERVRAPR